MVKVLIIVLNLVIALFTTGIIFLSLENRTSMKEKTFNIMLLGVCLGIFTICNLTGCYIENQTLRLKTEEYIAYKQTIEASLQNENLSGLERIELVKQASEQNAWLRGQQFEVKQWYNFYLSKEILKIEIIDVGG